LAVLVNIAGAPFFGGKSRATAPMGRNISPIERLHVQREKKKNSPVRPFVFGRGLELAPPWAPEIDSFGRARCFFQMIFFFCARVKLSGRTIAQKRPPPGRFGKAGGLGSQPFGFFPRPRPFSLKPPCPCSALAGPRGGQKFFRRAFPPLPTPKSNAKHPTIFPFSFRFF